jgi:hypothetical protein
VLNGQSISSNESSGTTREGQGQVGCRRVARSIPALLSTRGEFKMGITGAGIPSKGDQVELSRAGVTRLGYVWYADQLQVLVKWDDGTSSSLRVGRDRFYIRATAGRAAGDQEREPRQRVAAEAA